MSFIKSQGAEKSDATSPRGLASGEQRWRLDFTSRPWRQRWAGLPRAPAGGHTVEEGTVPVVSLSSPGLSIASRASVVSARTVPPCGLAPLPAPQHASLLPGPSQKPVNHLTNILEYAPLRLKELQEFVVCGQNPAGLSEGESGHRRGGWEGSGSPLAGQGVPTCAKSGF